MPRPEPRIDDDTIRRLAAYAGVDVPATAVARHREFLSAHAQAVHGWDRWPLGLDFTGGRVAFVHPLTTDELLRELPDAVRASTTNGTAPS